jgi:hypothetical protein
MESHRHRIMQFITPKSRHSLTSHQPAFLQLPSTARRWSLDSIFFCPRLWTLVSRLHLLLPSTLDPGLSTPSSSALDSRPWSLDSIFFCPRLSTLVSRLHLLLPSTLLPTRHQPPVTIVTPELRQRVGGSLPATSSAFPSSRRSRASAKEDRHLLLRPFLKCQ